MLPGLTENHERSLLASIQYAAQLLRDCDHILGTSDGSDPFSRYTGALSAPQQKIARDYLRRLHEQLQRTLAAVGVQPRPPTLGAVQGMRSTLLFIDNTFEEMRGRYLRGYGAVPPDADRILDGVVSEMQELVRDFDLFLSGVSDDVLQERLERLPATHPVAGQLRELSRLVAEHGLIDLRPALVMLVDRALENTFEVGVIGRVSSGKSSLLNALIGAPVLPTGVLPVTAFPTRVQHGAAPLLQVTFASGRTEALPIDRIQEFVTEASNPGNEKRLTRLLLAYPSDRLPEDVVFVDTPGLGSVASGSALQTFAYLPRCDHATFLFEATAPVSEEDLEVLAFLHDAGITTSVLLSKADLLSTDDLERVRGYVAAQIRKRLGSDIPVRPVSSMPTHESMLREWLRDEVTALGARAGRQAQEGLVRKTAVLREQVAAALERRTSTPATAISGSEPVVKRLRDVSARLERQSRELMSLQDHRTGIVEAGLAAVTGLYVDAAGEPPPASDAIRIALIRPTEILAGQLANDLNACARDVQSALAAAAAILGVATPAVDFPGLTQEIPMLDVPPVNLELKPPVWTRAGGFVRRKWFDDHVRQPLQPALDSAAAAYLDVLKKWANESLARIRREFESQSRPLLSQLTPSAGAAHSGGEALKRDLAQLRRQPIEVSHVPD